MITEHQRVTTHVNTARGLGLAATLTLAEWEQTIADFDGLCAYCVLNPFELLEHFIPLYTEGTHVKNCLPACQPCNTKKRSRIGSALVEIFGKETIDRLQHYLDSRISESNTGSSKATQKPISTQSGLYQWIPQAAKDLGVTNATLRSWMDALDIKVHKFKGDSRVFIATPDIEVIKEAKESPWEFEKLWTS